MACALILALLKAGSSMAARIAMMAITTKSSIKVNPLNFAREEACLIFQMLGCYFCLFYPIGPQAPGACGPRDIYSLTYFSTNPTLLARNAQEPIEHCVVPACDGCVNLVGSIHRGRRRPIPPVWIRQGRIRLKDIRRVEVRPGA